MATSQLPKSATSAKAKNSLAAALRAERIAELYLRGWTQTAIARDVGLLTRTVAKILGGLIIQWKEQAILNIGEAKALELERLFMVERTAWASFALSKTKENPAGDATWLRVTLECHSRRCKLLGLDEPEKIQTTVTVGEKFIEKGRMESEIAELLAKIPGTRFYVPPGGGSGGDGEAMGGNLIDVPPDGFPPVAAIENHNGNGHAHNGNGHPHDE